LVGQVYQTGQSVVRQPSIEGEVKVQTGFLVQALINVPIRVRNEIVGVLGVYNRTAPRTFTEHQLTILTALADWAGVGLEHAELVGLVESAPPVTGDGRAHEARTDRPGDRLLTPADGGPPAGKRLTARRRRRVRAQTSGWPAALPSP
jgi:GAF domain-containing protein